MERAELKEYGDRLKVGIAKLEQEIYQETGHEFNINSPKQLEEILFEQMELPGGKKTKTGYSTAADVLEKLAPDYPVVQKILDYRQLTKLNSTYAEGLAATLVRTEGFTANSTRLSRYGRHQQHGAEPSEYPGPHGPGQGNPQSVCSQGRLCVRGRGLFPD